MKVRLTSLALLAAAVLAGYAAPGALADDASLWNAYNGRADELDHALDAYSRASHRYQRSHGLAPQRIRAVIAADGRLVRVLNRLADDVRAEEPSSEPGARAAALAARGYIAWKLSPLYEIRALRARLHRQTARSERWYRKCLQIGERSIRYLKRADAAFAEVGFKHPESQKARRRVDAIGISAAP